MRLALALALLTALPATAQEAMVEYKALAPETALTAAQAALAHCAEGGYQVGVTVTDRFGTPQVFLRERYAGAHVHETSFRKAWTAASFQTSTTALSEETLPDRPAYGIRQLSQALPLGGGIIIEAGDGSLLGAIGVSGAPSPAIDDECAEAGIAAIFDDIAF